MNIKTVIIILNIVVVFAAGAVLYLNLGRGLEKNEILGKKKTDVSSLRCPDCNVILIGIDTLRADHLSSYGYFRYTSPNIDKFAENGVLFRNTFSASSKTTPSFMSIFTSLYPSDHGVLRTIHSTRKDIPYVRINDSVKTLAKVLKEQGYTTQAFVSSYQLPIEFGFGKGFDNFEINELTANRDNLLKWLKNNKDKKYFVFFHDIGTHDPYAPPQPYNTLYDPEYRGNITTDLPAVFEVDSLNSDRTFEEKLKIKRVYNKEVKDYFWSNVDINNSKDIYHLQALYDGEIKYLDDFIGRLQDVLLETNLVEKTIVIFTADHGEEFFEHGGFKHDQVYNEILRVPLILTGPSVREKIEIREYVSTIDIMPTILDFLNIPSSVPLRGRSLLSIIQNPSEEMNLPIVAMQYTHNIPPIQAIIKDGYKFILKETSYELYDLDSDPKELLNLNGNKRDRYKELLNDLQELLNDSKYIYKPILLNLILEEDQKEKLESLGY